jgi:hypothetical protein
VGGPKHVPVFPYRSSRFAAAKGSGHDAGMARYVVCDKLEGACNRTCCFGAVRDGTELRDPFRRGPVRWAAYGVDGRVQGAADMQEGAHCLPVMQALREGD